MKSDGAAVRISNGRPPAARTASLAFAAMASRWEKQIAISDEVFTTAILGFSMSASERPSARHWARRTAQRELPGSKFDRSVAGSRRGRVKAVLPRRARVHRRRGQSCAPPAPDNTPSRTQSLRGSRKTRPAAGGQRS